MAMLACPASSLPLHQAPVRPIRTQHRLPACSSNSRASSVTAACRPPQAPEPSQATRRELLSLPVLLASAAAAVQPAAVPRAASAGALLEREQEIVDIFEKTAGSVAIVYDVKTPVMGGAPTVGQAAGNGSGFAWDSNHVVTCYHVLAASLDGGAANKPGSKVAKVLFQAADGSSSMVLDGYLEGSDKARDLAVLRVEPPRPLAPLPLGDSSAVRVGQFALAVGSPFGFANTLTGGLVSATGRGFQSMTSSTIPGGIQTDAAVNPGNSGGPLLDSSGRVIGINTAIFKPGAAAGSVGVSFALPINLARRVVGDVIRGGRVTRPSLGIQPATDAVARALNVSSGVLIQMVDPGSPAEQAGLLGNRRGLRGVVAGDVIVSVDGRRINSLFDLSSLLDECSVGQTIEITAVRNAGSAEEERLTVKAVLAEERAK